jgi:gluconokinase
MAGVAYVVMGVSGSGKSTVAAEAARRLGRPFLEADDLHSPANRAKMAAGQPLTDEDRWPWLRLVRSWLVEHPDGLAACSSLRRAYRDLLRTAGDTVFVHLSVPAPLLRERLAARRDHWMPATLLDSQLAALEPLALDEGVTLDGRLPMPQVTDQLVALVQRPRPSERRL